MADDQDMDTQVIDIEEIGDADFKINPDVYIHNAIVKAQNSLTNTDLKTGFLQYRVYIEMLEGLARARNRIPEKYAEDIAAYQTTDDYKKTEETIKPIKLATKKMELLLTEIFKGTVATAPMRM